MDQAHLYQALKVASRLLDERVESLPSGIESLDRLLAGGFPKGRISEISGAPSSGKSSVVFATLAEGTRQGEVAAYIDTFDTFDPQSAAQAGIDLNRLLWIRCRGSREKACAAADLVTRAGGFGIVVLDQAPADEQQRHIGSGRVPSHSWFRLKQALEGTRAVLVVVTLIPATGSASHLVVNMNRTKTVWKAARESLRRPGLFQGLVFEAEIYRGKGHGGVTLCSGF